MAHEAVCLRLVQSPYIYIVYCVIKSAYNVALISTRKCYICGLTMASVAQTIVEGLDKILNNYSESMFKEDDVG